MERLQAGYAERPGLVISVDLLGVLANRGAFPKTYNFDFEEAARRVVEEWHGLGTPRQIVGQVHAEYMRIFMSELGKPENGVLNKEILDSLKNLAIHGYKNGKLLDIIAVTRLPEEVISVFYQKYPKLKRKIEVIEGQEKISGLLAGYVGNNSIDRAKNMEPIFRGFRETGFPYLAVSDSPEELAAFLNENVHKLIYYGGNASEEERGKNIAVMDEMARNCRDKFCRFAAVADIHDFEREIYSMIFG